MSGFIYEDGNLKIREDSLELTKELVLGETTAPTNETDKGKIYTKDVSTATELFYMDALGNEVQITTGGSMNVAVPIDTGTADGQLAFWDSGTSKWTNTETSELVWDDTQKFFGVGTDTPEGVLHVVKPTNNSTEAKRQYLRISMAGNSNYLGVWNNSSGTANFAPWFYGKNNSSSSTYPLGFVGDAGTQDTGETAVIALQASIMSATSTVSNRSIVDFRNHSTVVKRIKNDGSTGIGTTSINEMLTVNGAISLSEMTSPSLTADHGKIYTKDVSAISELFYLDSSGNEVQLTSGGAINESPSTKIEWGTSNVTIEASGGDITLDNAGANILTVSSGGFDVGASGQVKFSTSYDNGTTTDSILFETTSGVGGGGDIKFLSTSDLYLNCTNMYLNSEMYFMNINGSALWDIDDTRYCLFTPSEWITTATGQIKFTSSLDNSSFSSILLETTVGTTGGGDIGINSAGDTIVNCGGDIKFLTAGGDLHLLIDSSGKIATGHETAPDTMVGGICYYGTDMSGNLLSFKARINHPFTGIQEGDTFGTIELKNNDVDGWGEGSLKISGYSGDGKNYPNYVGSELWGYSENGMETKSTSAIGTIILGAATVDNGNPSIFAGRANIVVFREFNKTRHIFENTGDIVTDTGAINAFDDEDDINLARAGAYSMSGQKDKIMDYGLRKYAKRLEELGIIENGFMSHNKINSLQLGAIGQLWNIVRGLGKRFGLTDRQLLEISKEYE